MKQTGIKATVIEEIRSLAKRRQIGQVILFGSRTIIKEAFAIYPFLPETFGWLCKRLKRHGPYL